MFGEAFDFERPSLLRLLRSVLVQYRNDGQILKELIQNAEDAEATKITFLFDNVSYKCQTESNQKYLGDLFGPALIAYNDAFFTESDWHGISKLYDSVKTNKPMKVGRFGLGFKSVYHITDVPWILSGSKMALQDPTESRFTSAQGNVSSGRLFSLSTSNPELKECLNCFNVLETVENTKCIQSQFKGTAIRLPIRTCRSKKNVVETLCTVNDIKELIHSLKTTEYMNILFLKHVKEISVFWRESLTAAPITLFKLSTKESFLSKAISPKNMFENTELESTLKNIVEEVTNKRHLFMVVTMTAGKTDVSLSSEIKEFMTDSQYTALTSVALSCTDLNMSGHSFVLLPLPLRHESPTGLPIHVNGFFSITQDRQFVRLPTEDQNFENLKDKDLRWNISLIKEMLPRCYVDLLLVTAQKRSEKDSILSYFPDRNTAKSIWKLCVDEFYILLVKKYNSKLLFPCTNLSLTDFDNLTYMPASSYKDIYQAIRYLYSTLNMQCPVLLPKHIIDGLEKVNTLLVKTKIVTLDTVLKLLFDNVHLLQFEKVQYIIQMALTISAKSESTQNLFKNYCWIPTENQFRQPLYAVNPQKDIISRLFTRADNVFPSNSYAIFKNSSNLDQMEIFGLQGNVLFNQELVTVALLSIEFETRIEIRIQRLKTFIQFFDLYTDDNILKAIKDNFTTKQFLLVQQQENTIFTFLNGNIFENHYQWAVEYVASTFNRYELGFSNNSTLITYLELNCRPNIVTIFNNVKIFLLNNLGVAKLIEMIIKLLNFIEKNNLDIIEAIAVNYFFKEAKCLPNVYGIPCYLKSLCLEKCPYLHDELQQIHVDLSDRCRPILKKIGIRDKFDTEDYQHILKTWSEEKKSMTIDECKGYVTILEFLVQNSVDDNVIFYLPSQAGILLEGKQVCLNDTPWIESTSKFNNLDYCHNCIPIELAYKCGARSNREMLVIKDSDIIPFEQSEPLTIRLRNIIERYGTDEDVFKEFLQNADDAGASEIHFILDLSSYGKERVMNDEWGEHMQGPSLIIANNGKFTKEDIKGIQALGQGSKSNAEEKIGQFGQGFNAAYRLTDFPSFMTTVDNQTSISIFDPHCKVVKEVKTCGMQIKVTQKICSTFPDMYNPFLPHLYKNWTIFRLPLRNASQALFSEIIKKECDLETFKSLFQNVSLSINSWMIFLNNIKLCKFLEISANSKNPVEFSNCFKQNKDLQSKPRENSLLTLVTINNNQNVDKYIVSKITDSQNAQSIIREIKRTQNSKAEFCVKANGAVALPIAKPQNMSNPIYFYLPLPTKLDLPVIVNGHWIVDDSRRGVALSGVEEGKIIWNKFMASEIVSNAYANLIVWATSNYNYIFNENITFCSKKYFELFPGYPWISLCESIKNEITNGLYRNLMNRRASVIPELDCNYELVAFHDVPHKSIGSCQVLDTIVRERSHITWLPHKEHVTEYQRNMLVLLGMKLTEIPSHIVNSFQKIEGIIDKISPLKVVQFLKQNPPRTPTHISQTVFKSVKGFCEMLDYIIRGESVTDFPLCITAADNLITLPRDKQYLFNCGFELVCPSNSNDTIHKDIEERFSSLYEKYARQPTLNELFQCLKGNCPKLVDSTTFDLANSIPKPFNTVEWNDSLWNLLACLHHEYIYNNQRLCYNVQHLQHEAEDSKQFIANLIKIFSNVFIFRVLYNNRNVYLPLSMSKMILETDDDLNSVIGERPWSLYTITFKSVSQLERNHSQLLQSACIANLRCPNDILECIYGYFTTNNEMLTSKNAMMLMTYLTEHLDCFMNIVDISKIKEIPIHKTLTGQLIAINAGNIQIVPINKLSSSEFNLEEISKCQTQIQQCSIIYIWPQSEKCATFYEKIGFKMGKMKDIYINFVLPQFSEFSDIGKKKHLKYIMNNFYQENVIGDQDLHQHLIKTPIIADSNSELQCASFFVDDSIEIFKVFYPSIRHFSSTTFQKDKWIDFMRIIGIKRLLTEDEILQLCSLLETEEIENNEQKQVWLNKSKLLIKYIIHYVIGKISNRQINNGLKSFCQTVSFKKIIGIDIKSPNQFVKTICFNSSYAYKCRNLISYVADFLPSYAKTNPKNTSELNESLNSLLGIITKPEIKVVANNIFAIMKIEIQDNKVKELQTSLAACFKFLQDSKDTTKASITQIFAKLPCILLKTNIFVCPLAIVKLGMDGIFLHDLPECFDSCWTLLQTFGASEKPEIKNYLHALECYKKIQPGNPTQTESATTIFVALCELIFKSPNTLPITEFYFFVKEDELQPSQDCILCDLQIYENILEENDLPKVLTNSSSISFGMINKICSYLPKHLKPVLMTELVNEGISAEELDHSKSGIYIERLDSFLTFINSNKFVENIVKVINHYSVGFNKESLNTDTENIILEKWKNISVEPCSALSVTYTPKDEIKFNIPSVSESDCPYYLTKNACKEKIEYIAFVAESTISKNEDWNKFLIEFSSDITEFVSSFEQKKITVVVQSLFFCTSIDDMSKVLKKYKISDYQICSDVVVTEKTKEGRFLTQEEIALLSHSISSLEEICVGDYVAYLCSSDCLANEDNTNQDVFMVVKVVDIVEAPSTDGGSFGSFDIQLDKTDNKCVTVSGIDLRVFIEVTQSKEHNFIQSPCDSNSIDKNIREVQMLLTNAEMSTDDKNMQKKIKRRAVQLLTETTSGTDNEDVVMDIINKTGISQCFSDSITDAQTHILNRSVKHKNSRKKLFTSFEQTYQKNHQKSAKFPRMTMGSGGISFRASLVVFDKEISPNPFLGKRYLKQAKADFNAVPNDCGFITPAYEWACTKCQQAAEKCLKGIAIYNGYPVGDLMYKHDLGSLASRIQSEDSSRPLPMTALSNIAAIGSYSELRYPTISSTPTDTFSNTDVKIAIDAVSEIIEWSEKEMQYSSNM